MRFIPSVVCMPAYSFCGTQKKRRATVLMVAYCLFRSHETSCARITEGDANQQLGKVVHTGDEVNTMNIASCAHAAIYSNLITHIYHIGYYPNCLVTR